MPRENVDERDVDHFSSFADEWWDLKGPCKILHIFNTVRVPFVKNGLKKTGKAKNGDIRGLKILDVGCATGILSEALAKEGAEVVGIDPGEKLIEVAEDHVKGQKIKVEYLCELIQDHAKKRENYYDAVVASEVVEHVIDQEAFLKACAKALKPGGSIFITTLNKTFSSWFFGMIWAEYILRLFPSHTHTFDQFISPQNVERILGEANCHKAEVTGFFYEFYRGKYRFCSNDWIQYGLHAVKNYP